MATHATAAVGARTQVPPTSTSAYLREVDRWRAEQHLAPRPGGSPPRRCDHCHAWFAPSPGEPSSPLRYCSEAHRHAGALRARLGLRRDALPEASVEEVRRLGRAAADAAGRQPGSAEMASPRPGAGRLEEERGDV